MPALEPRDPGPRHASGPGPTNPPPAPQPRSEPTGPRPSPGPSRRPSAAAPTDRPTIPLRSVATVRLADLPHRFRAKLLGPEDLGPRPEPVPDPFEDVDALEEMEEKIIFEAVHHHAGVYRLLVWVGEFVRRRGWELQGHRTPAHWLHFVTSFDLGTCREKIRVARALPDLPLISAAMAKGELSFAKVR
jgi:hypothetical protein